MKKNLRIILSFSLTALLAYIVFLFTKTTDPQEDVLQGFEELRSTPTAFEIQKAKYDDYMSFIDSLKGKELYEKALQYLDTLEGLGIYEEKVIIERGKLFFESEQYLKAKYEFTNALEVSDFLNLKAYAWRSYTYLELNNCDSALLDISKAYSANPSFFGEDYKRIMKDCSSSQ